MKKSRIVRYGLEYVALRIIFAVLNAVPIQTAVALARWMAALVYRCAHERRRIAVGNILRVGIASDEKEATRIARASFLHFGAMAVESVMAGEFFEHHNLIEHVRVDMDEETRYLMEDPQQGVILATAHLGNWELGATRMGLIKPVLSVARDMNNPYVNRFLAERTHRAHMRIIPKRTGRRSPMVSALKDGESIALLTDQHARTKAMIVDFIGVPAASETSPARLHLASGAPIVPAFCIREGPMRYRIKAGPAIRQERTGDRDADIRSVIEAINGAVEQVVREHPDQYLWSHRRWRA